VVGAKGIVRGDLGVLGGVCDTYFLAFTYLSPLLYYHLAFEFYLLNVARIRPRRGLLLDCIIL
jgi:hypothetical protein